MISDTADNGPLHLYIINLYILKGPCHFFLSALLVDVTMQIQWVELKDLSTNMARSRS